MSDQPQEIAPEVILATLEPVKREVRPSFLLADALLCVSCDLLYEQHADGCPHCKSAVAFPISRVINRRT